MTDRVLVLLLDPAGASSCLRVAAEAARALAEPEITVLHVRGDPSATVLASEEVLPEQRRAVLARQAEADALAIHAAWIAWEKPVMPVSWQQVDGVAAEVVRASGPQALLVMTLPPAHAPPAQRNALEAALFSHPQPVLAVPHDWAGGFGTHLAVGWCNTPAMERALVAARPWLLRSAEVSVLAVAAASPGWPDAGAFGAPSQRVSFQLIDPVGRDEGETLLVAVANAGLDGLVMGAYRRSPILEWAMGGVTRHVLHSATLPLLMVH